MASRVLLMEPPGSPATMIVWIEKSVRGSRPFSLIFSPKVQAYDGDVQMTVGWYCCSTKMRRSLGTAPTQMASAPRRWAPMTSGPPTYRAKFKPCT